MSRFFIEVAYKGTNYSGFQIQQNAVTIQSELEKAMTIFFREPITLTGSSRTDAGVHAKQNFFHFDLIRDDVQEVCNATYNINAILPEDIAVLSIVKVKDNAHCRFDAFSRLYEYTLYNKKDPFLTDFAYYYPYHANLEQLNKAAVIVLNTINFETFCKKNVQVLHYDCKIEISQWTIDKHKLLYTVQGNRFLRGMVRGLVGTMLKVGAKKISLQQFETIVASKDARNADFSVPARGLSLIKVSY